MAQGLGGLAQGLIQGAQLGMQFKNNERQAEQDKELSGLRQLAEKREQESHEQRLTLNDLESKRQAEQLAINKTKSGINERTADRMDLTEKRQDKVLDLQEKQFAWDKSRKEREDLMQRVSAMAPVEFNNVLNGGELSQEYVELAAGTPLDPMIMAKPEYKKAAKFAYEYAGDLVQKVKEQGPESVSVVDLNNQEFLSSLNVLMKTDIERGVGTKDPTTGRTIVGKEIARAMPYQNQGVVIDVLVKLDDGTDYIAPITENQSTDPDDPVRVIPIDKLINNIDGHMRMASAFEQENVQNAVLRYNNTGKTDSSAEATKRQYLKELGTADKEEAKALAGISEMYSGPEREKEAARIRNDFKTMRDRSAARYGQLPQNSVGKGDAAVAEPRNNGQKSTDINVWMKNDPKKAAFSKEFEAYASESGDSPIDAFSPVELDKLYNAWTERKQADEADELAAALKK